MDAQSLLYLSMLGGNGTGMNSDSILPIVLMQLSKKGSNGDSDTNEGVNPEVLDVIVYRPLGQRILNNFAQRIAKMTATQRANLMAALALDRLSTQQEGKFAEALLLASRACMLDLLGEPMSNISIPTEKKGNGTVGMKTLGPAKKSVIEKAKELEVNESGSNSGSKSSTSSVKKYPPVY